MGSDMLLAPTTGGRKTPFRRGLRCAGAVFGIIGGSVVTRFHGQELALQSMGHHAVAMGFLRGPGSGIERPAGSTGRGWVHAGAAVPGCADITTDAHVAVRLCPERARRPDGCGQNCL